MGLRLKAVIQRLTAMAPSLWFEKKNGSSSDPGQSIGATGNLTVERTDPLYSLNEDSIENLYRAVQTSRIFTVFQLKVM